MPSVFLKTYGCQMNERDSEAVAAMLRARGYRLVPDEQDCDVLLLNTCSVRDAAEQKALAKAGSSGAAGAAQGLSLAEKAITKLGISAEAAGPALGAAMSAGATVACGAARLSRKRLRIRLLSMRAV